MTCIVGLEVENGVIIGGDSAAPSGWDIYTTRLPKVFRLGNFIVGYTTSFRMGQLLQYRLKVEPKTEGQNDIEYMVATFIDAVRACLKEGGFAKVENEQEEGGQFLVGYNGRLYEVHADFQVNSSENGYHAVGCGANYALGSLWTSRDWLDPAFRVNQALKAAGHFSNGVRPPYYTEFLPTRDAL